MVTKAWEGYMTPGPAVITADGDVLAELPQLSPIYWWWPEQAIAADSSLSRLHQFTRGCLHQLIDSLI